MLGTWGTVYPKSAANCFLGRQGPGRFCWFWSSSVVVIMCLAETIPTWQETRRSITTLEPRDFASISRLKSIGNTPSIDWLKGNGAGNRWIHVFLLSRTKMWPEQHPTVVFFWETPIKSSTGKFPLSIWKSFRNGRVCHFATNAARDFDQYSWLLYLQKLASTTHSLQRLETCEYIHGLWKYGTHIENRHQNRHGLIIHSQHFLRSSSRTCAAPHPSTSCQLSWGGLPSENNAVLGKLKQNSLTWNKDSYRLWINDFFHSLTWNVRRFWDSYPNPKRHSSEDCEVVIIYRWYDIIRGTMGQNQPTIWYLGPKNEWEPVVAQNPIVYGGVMTFSLFKHPDAQSIRLVHTSPSFTTPSKHTSSAWFYPSIAAPLYTFRASKQRCLRRLDFCNTIGWSVRNSNSGKGLEDFGIRSDTVIKSAISRSFFFHTQTNPHSWTQWIPDFAIRKPSCSSDIILNTILPYPPNI